VVKKAKQKGAKKASKKTSGKSKPIKKKALKKKVSKKKSTKKKAAPKKSTKKKAAPKKAGKVAAKKPKSRKAAAKKTAKKPPTKPAKQKKSSGKKGATAKTRRAATTPGSARRKLATRNKRKTAGGSNLLSGPVRGFKPYRPKRGEDYMSDSQLEHFHELLSAWKQELMEEVDRTMLHMKDDAANFPDPNDRATQESEFGLELRTRDRERKLLKKIGSALLRIDEGSYGFCEETGDEIGLRRLEARPVATLCLEAQERRELAERQFRDREDHYR
jgi:DnaK suppressor protein